MDYKALSQVTDSIEGKKVNRTVSADMEVSENENPFDHVSVAEKIQDSKKVIIIDDVLIKKLASSPRNTRRKFLASLSDSKRRRVLGMIKRVTDSGFSENLGFILLDTVLGNVLQQGGDSAIETAKTFVNTQTYTDFSDNVNTVINQVLSGETDLNPEGVEEIKEGCGDYQSNIWSFTHPVSTKVIKEDISEDVSEEVEDDFVLPDELDLTEEDEVEIKNAVDSHISNFVQDHNLLKLLDSVDELLADFQGKNRKYKQTSDKYWSCFEEAWKEHAEELEAIKDAVSILDEDAVDKYASMPEFDEDGNEIKNFENRSILSLFSEALDDFASGSEDKLKALSEKSFKSTEDDYKTGEVDELVETKEKEDTTDENDEDEEVYEESDDVVDSVIKCARGILNKENVNALVDSLKDKVPAFKKFNFKITDCALPYHDVKEASSSYNIPITHDEYYASNPTLITPVMEEELDECAVMPLSMEEYSLENGCLSVGGQVYYPYKCSSEEFEQRLNEAEESGLQEIVGSYAAPLEDVMRVAAKYDNLPLIDTRFYKPSHCCDGWKFDERPACLVEAPEGNFIKRTTEKDANYHLFGVPFSVLSV